MFQKCTVPLFGIVVAGFFSLGVAQAKDLVPAYIHAPQHANIADCYKLEKIYRMAVSHQTKVPASIRNAAQSAHQQCVITHYGKGVDLYEHALHALEK